jgi:hypothetical protein
VKGYLKTLPWINTAPVPADLSTDIPTQVEPRFISKKYKFWVKNTSMYRLQEPVPKMRSSLEITFFSYLTCLILYGSRHNFSVSLFMLLSPKSLPVQLIVPGIYKATF